MSSIATHTAPRTVDGTSPSPRALAVRAGRDLLYLTIGLATSGVAFAVWVAGLTASAVLLPFIVGLPVAIGVAAAVRWTATLDRRNAAVLDGRPIAGRYRDHSGPGIGARLRGTFSDPQTWRDLAWLGVHSVIGFGFGVVALSLAAESVAIAVLPLWFWAIPGGVDLGLWSVNTVPLAFATALLAIPHAALTVALLRGMAAMHGGLARRLLG